MIAIVALTLILASASAAPQRYDYGGSQGGARQQGFAAGPVIPILRDNRQGPIDGVYSFDFETGDGISRQEQGAPTGPNGAVVQQGAWSFTFPDGTPAQFSFIADEGGYRVESPLIPTPHPLPAHAIEQIRKAEAERAQGIIHDGQYRGEGQQSGQYSGQQSGQQSPQYSGQQSSQSRVTRPGGQRAGGQQNYY